MGHSTVNGPDSAMYTVPYDCVLTGWQVTADVVGNVTVQVRRGGTSLVGSGTAPGLSGASSGSSSSLTGWTTALSAGDVLWISISGVSGVGILRINFKTTTIQ